MAERATSPREWALAVAGGLALAGGLVWWWRGPTPEPAPTVELTASQPMAAPTPPPPPPAAPGVDMSAMVLRGVLLGADGGSAIIEAAGRQRLVRAGGMVVPGVRLAAVSAGSVRLASGDSEQRLLLDSDRTEPEPEEIITGAPLEATVESLAATSNDYRLALVAVRGADGRISGWTVRDTSRLPLLRLAGMRPGDVLLAVNDIPLYSAEKVIDLPTEVATAYTAKVKFSRGDRITTVEIAVKR